MRKIEKECRGPAEIQATAQRGVGSRNAASRIADRQDRLAGRRRPAVRAGFNGNSGHRSGANFDAITRLAAEYFKADTVLLGFGDESRVWIKSYWGEPVRELPRKHSVFERVLAEDGPVVVSNIDDDPQYRERRLPVRRLEALRLRVLRYAPPMARFWAC
jgi:hypothetical protein